MARTITIHPLTRITVLMKIEVEVENGEVVDARSSGTCFRGFEAMLIGRSPRDAPWLTGRLCGICSVAQAAAGTDALDKIHGLEIPNNGRLIRNILLATEWLQNHIRHFYQFGLLDYVRAPDRGPFLHQYRTDMRLPSTVNDRLMASYFESFKVGRNAHSIQAIFGGIAPHQKAYVAGGATVVPNADNVLGALGFQAELYRFIIERMVPDAYTLAHFYADYYQIGAGPGNLLVYGTMEERDGSLFFPRGVRLDEEEQPLDLDAITEHVGYAWYRHEDPRHPWEGVTDPDPYKKEGYSWIKAPRYRGQPMEAGPLARMWIKGEYRRGISVMDRTLARVLETKLVAEKLRDWLLELEPGKPAAVPWRLRRTGRGVGLNEAPRGAVGHWVEIQNWNIAHYQIITPTTWNCSPRDDSGKRGTVEEALIGTSVENPDEPVEVGRVVRSFDPCLGCAMHLCTPRRRPGSLPCAEEAAAGAGE